MTHFLTYWNGLSAQGKGPGWSWEHPIHKEIDNLCTPLTENTMDIWKKKFQIWLMQQYVISEVPGKTTTIMLSDNALLCLQTAKSLTLLWLLFHLLFFLFLLSHKFLKSINTFLGFYLFFWLHFGLWLRWYWFPTSSAWSLTQKGWALGTKTQFPNSKVKWINRFRVWLWMPWNMEMSASDDESQIQ